MKYCSKCGTVLVNKTVDGQEQLARSDECGFINWNSTTPVVAGLVMVKTSSFWQRMQNGRPAGGEHSSAHSNFNSSHHGAGTPNSHDHTVSGYKKKGGTYVASHQARNSNGTGRDNFSTTGNTNRYTKKAGNKLGGY